MPERNQRVVNERATTRPRGSGSAPSVSTADICAKLGCVTLDGTILGKGGYGIVYRGTWDGHLAADSSGPRMDGDKTAVAVKHAPAGEVCVAIPLMSPSYVCPSH